MPRQEQLLFGDIFEKGFWSTNSKLIQLPFISELFFFHIFCKFFLVFGVLQQLFQPLEPRFQTNVLLFLQLGLYIFKQRKSQFSEQFKQSTKTSSTLSCVSSKSENQLNFEPKSLYKILFKTDYSKSC